MREKVRFESSDYRFTVEQTFGCGKGDVSSPGTDAATTKSLPQRRKGAKKISSSLRLCGKQLKVQLQPELELPRVERRGWAAVVAAVAGALVEGVDVGNEW